jgi:uncharacterized protein YlxW (UPF0749 family)
MRKVLNTQMREVAVDKEKENFAFQDKHERLAYEINDYKSSADQADRILQLIVEGILPIVSKH